MRISLDAIRPVQRLGASLALATLLVLAACGEGSEQSELNDGGEPVAAAEPAIEEPAPAEPAAVEPPPVELPAPPAEANAALTDPDPPTAWDGRLPPFAAAEPELDAAMAALLETADPDRGRSYAQRCIGCHSFAEELTADGPQAGPPLFGIVGARIGKAFAFDYSPVFAAMHDAGVVWTPARLDAFLADPIAAVPGTLMDRAAIADPANRADVIAYLATLVVDTTVIAGGEELLARIAAADPTFGEEVAAHCAVCHSLDPGGAAHVGPNLYGLIGSPIGGREGFNYSAALRDLNADGAVWTVTRLDAFLASPAVAIPGTRMGFAGINDAGERAALIAYLRTQAEEILPLATEQLDDLLGIGRAQPGLAPLTFTSTQFLRGDLLFYTDGNCNECHGQSLRGGVSEHDDAPALVGAEFAERWFAGTVFALFDYIGRHTETYIRDDLVPYFVAFVLQRNGFRTGNRELPVDRESLEAMGFYQ